MLNETMPIVHISKVTWDYVSGDLLGRGIDIVEAPVKTPDMLWMLLPLLATLILMEFYFGRYKEEEMGWNTAFSNSLILIFISIDLFRHLQEPSGLSVIEFILSATEIKVIIPLWIAGLALTLMLVDFFHFMPKRLAYIICSPAYVNLLGLLGIIIVYTAIPFNWTTILACVIIFVLANLLSLLIYYIVPSYKPTIQKILTVDDIEKYGEQLKKKKA